MIEALKISHQYEGRPPLFTQVSFSLNTGEMVSLTGESGCGKTTLLFILGGSLKPQVGEVKKKCGKKEIGFLYQDPHLMEGFHVLDNILISGTINGVNKSRERALDLARKLNIEHLLKSHVSYLSAGERQRVALAQVMMKNPKLVLADEVTGNLDAANSELVLSLLQDMKKNSCIVLATHDQELSAKADRTLVLRDGTLLSNSA